MSFLRKIKFVSLIGGLWSSGRSLGVSSGFWLVGIVLDLLGSRIPSARMVIRGSLALGRRWKVGSSLPSRQSEEIGGWEKFSYDCKTKLYAYDMIVFDVFCSVYKAKAATENVQSFVTSFQRWTPLPKQVLDIRTQCSHLPLPRPDGNQSSSANYLQSSSQTKINVKNVFVTI